MRSVTPITVILAAVAGVAASDAGYRLTSSPPQSGQMRTPRPPLAVVELRQYTLLPGKRDVLLNLFEREFIEGQEAAGMTILGQFHDLDRPDRFVWIRGFPDMPTRARSLAAFYDGPVWQAHRAVANATMVDSTNVLMLRPARDGVEFAVDPRSRPPRGSTEAPPTVVTAAIYSFEKPVDEAFIQRFDREIQPAGERAGAQTLASFVTEAARNNFPRLPLREGEHVFIWFASFPNEAAYGTAAASADWRMVTGAGTGSADRKPEMLRLRPTPRSLIGR